MYNLLDKYRSAIIRASDFDIRRDPTLSGSLVIERHGDLAVSYAPFEHIERLAMVALVGITPGAQQASNSLTELRSALRTGSSDDEALTRAKVFASFSGPMRSNLVALLDFLGIHTWLGLPTTEQLWGEARQRAHFTSGLRNPVFVGDKNYSGRPSVRRTDLLRRCVEEWLSEEVRSLPKSAIWVPLGPTANECLSILIDNGELDSGRVLSGLPHPSGANAERIAYFLGRKAQEKLSAKTNANTIDLAKRVLTRQMAAISGKPLTT